MQFIGFTRSPTRDWYYRQNVMFKDLIVCVGFVPVFLYAMFLVVIFRLVMYHGESFAHENRVEC